MRLHKLKSLILLGALCVVPVSAQVSASPERFSPQACGYLERARAMRTGNNYAGVVDQLDHLIAEGAALTAEQAEECAFLLADAWYERGDERCLQMLADFCEDYPASRLAPQAAMALADRHFFAHEWPDALLGYQQIDTKRLNPELQQLCTYRTALSMIKTGHFREARPLLARLRGKTDYNDARLFYSAYLDYIDGDFKRAYEQFARVPEGIAGLDAGYYMTQIEYSDGRYDEAISRGARLLRGNVPAELVPELNRVVGLSYFKTDDYTAAAPLLRKYLETNDGTPSADALYALGAIEYADGDYDRAADLFAQVTEGNDALAQGAWLYIGQCHMRRDNPSSAAMAFEKATRLNYDPKVGETALYNYVTAVTRGGKVPFSSSSQLLENFVSRYPDSDYTPEVEAYLATAYYNDREYSKALDCIDAIRNPSAEMLQTRQKTLYRLGVEAMTNGKPAQAAEWLRQAAAMKTQNRELAAQSALWLGDAMFAQGRYADAQRAYEQCLADRSSSTNRDLAYYDLAYAKFKQKNYAGAAADFGRINMRSKQLPAGMLNDALARRADCLYYTGKYSEARNLFSQAIADGHDDSDYALYRHALLNGLAGDTKAKLSDLQKLADDYPDSRWRADALLEMAHLYEEQGRNDLAADAYRQRLDAMHDVDTDELLRMASAMYRGERYEDLLAVTQKIRNAGGLDTDELAEISLMEADALTALGRSGEAEEIYTTLAQNPTSAAGSRAVVTLAENLVKQKEFAEAKNLMEEFTDTGTPHEYWLARGFITLADAYHGLGDTSLAREYLLSLRDNYPGSESDIAEMIATRLKKWK